MVKKAYQMKRIPVTMNEYSKRLDKILDSTLPIDEKIVAVVCEASKYRLVDATISRKSSNWYKSTKECPSTKNGKHIWDKEDKNWCRMCGSKRKQAVAQRRDK